MLFSSTLQDVSQTSDIRKSGLKRTRLFSFYISGQYYCRSRAIIKITRVYLQYCIAIAFVILCKQFQFAVSLFAIQTQSRDRGYRWRKRSLFPMWALFRAKWQSITMVQPSCLLTEISVKILRMENIVYVLFNKLFGPKGPSPYLMKQQIWPVYVRRLIASVKVLWVVW